MNEVRVSLPYLYRTGPPHRRSLAGILGVERADPEGLVQGEGWGPSVEWRVLVNFERYF